MLRIGLDNLWNEIARKEAPLQGNFFRQILYSGGNDLYWITNDKVIVMDVDKEIIVREYLFISLYSDSTGCKIFMDGKSLLLYCA